MKKLPLILQVISMIFGACLIVYSLLVMDKSVNNIEASAMLVCGGILFAGGLISNGHNKNDQ